MNDTGHRKIIKKDTNPKVAGILSSDQIVKIIFSNTDSIFEKRLQSVAYLSELEWLMNYNNSKQLSTVTYIRTPKSIF